MINEVRSFLSDCPYISDRLININYLSSRCGSLSLENVSTKKLIKEYTDGSRLCRAVFIIATRESATESVGVNGSVADLFENISRWLEKQNYSGNFPILPDGFTPVSIAVDDSHELKAVSNTSARHEMSFELRYCEKF